jgi:sugar lactone lactonase YvrE
MKLLYGFLVFGMGITSSASQWYEASDYVYVGDFTTGLEGPAADVEGNLYFVNPHHSGSIGKVDANGQFSIFVEQLPQGSTANGIRINGDGKLLLADYTGHNILELDPGTKEVKVFAHEPGANQPNDLTLGADGLLFASDPNWKESTGNIWRVEPGKFVNVASNTGTTNGIEISPDGKTLYVNESVQRQVWAFDITPEKTLANKRLLVSFQDFGMDGMRCDVKGNLYITRHGKGTVVKVSPAGEILEEITLKGQKPSNIAFGGPDGRSAFVTLQDRGYIETFRVPDPGNAFSVMYARRDVKVE